MIDCHCHLESHDYDNNRDEIIEKCKKELKAIITSCAHPKDFEKTLEMTEKHRRFVFASYGIHPEYIKEVSEKDVEEFIEKVRKNRNNIVAIGECGMDKFWVKEVDWQDKQKDLFARLISLSKEMNKPVVIHSRDAYSDVLDVLEVENAKNVLLHLWGEKNFIRRITENGWYISMGPILLRSKNHKKMVRDTPLENIMTETDSPWFGVGDKIGIPTNVKFVVQKIAEIKKLDVEEVDRITTQNAIKFFSLNI